MTLHDFTLRDINGQERSLREYAGKTVLVVNTASQCGLTPQYATLELFYRQFQDHGLEILGIPSNDFGGQEPGTEADIKAFCERNYEVSFPMFSKVPVKGVSAHPLYKWLAEQTGQEPQWNFHKYLLDRHGNVIRGFAPTVTVEMPELHDLVARELSNEK